MEKIIRAAVERGASDLHIKAGDVFRARIHGKLVPLTKQRLTPDQTRAIALKLLANDADRAKLDGLRDFDCSWGMPGVGRFRVNVLRQRSSIMIVMRVIPFAVPTLETLGLPARLGRLAESDRGMIIVAGISGGGKSSTMAALVQHINTTQQRHIVTVENPIEFLHRDLSSSVTQREVGVDTDTYASGLRAALRQDPDVVVIGELVDAETTMTAIKAAESGFLVLTSMPTADVASTIDRVVTMLPKDEREIGRVRFAECLRAIVAQQLLPRRDEPGKVAALELVVATPPIKAALRDTARAGDLKNLMAAGGEHGMQTFEQHLSALVGEGRLTAEAARAAAIPDTSGPPPGVPERRKRGSGPRSSS
ncbi:MAG: PilT/PilU family type 4a pilus ATPase [Gemmatimonadales bacterium]|jgi:twitching motility protein PilT|nr:PilT/PilU family type 4a pilus ATPase [Gemmatimonadales bacterium]